MNRREFIICGTAMAAAGCVADLVEGDCEASDVHARMLEESVLAEYIPFGEVVPERTIVLRDATA